MSTSKAARIEFNDRLIAAVQKRPILWDSGRLDYKDQRKKHATWKEIAAELGCDHRGTNLPARWKSLRDTFTKKYRVAKNSAPSSSPAEDGKKEKEITWPYFNLLKFLKGEADIGSTVSNMSEPARRESAETVLEFICSDSGEVQDVEVLDDVSGDAAVDSSLEATTSSDTSQPAPADRVTSRRRKSPKQKHRWEAQREKVGQLAAQNDQASLYGHILAAKFRACPKRIKYAMELELLDFLKKYTFEEP